MSSRRERSYPRKFLIFRACLLWRPEIRRRPGEPLERAGTGFCDTVRYFKPFEKESAPGASYEMEYILCGDERERENLAGTVTRLTALRSGLNLAHLTDASKRQEARTMAAAIVGGTGLLPLVSVMAFFIMTQWALGEAIADVKCLLSGGRIPLIKSASQWKLDLDGLLEMGREGNVSQPSSAVRKAWITRVSAHGLSAGGKKSLPDDGCDADNIGMAGGIFPGRLCFPGGRRLCLGELYFLHWDCGNMEAGAETSMEVSCS